MKTSKIPYLLSLALLCPFVSSLSAHNVDEGGISRVSEVTEEYRKLIEGAIPTEATVEPKEPRKILVLNLHYSGDELRSGHASIPYLNYAIEFMGNASGAWETEYTEDITDLNRENLAQYDALVFNNTAGVLTDDPEIRSALLDFVYAGGGFVGTHAAGATFCQWPNYDIFPEFGEMLGGFESGGHPWKPHEWIVLQVNDKTHPVGQSFLGFPMGVSDEVFQFTDPYSSNRQRIVLSIDTERTDMDPRRNILPERLIDGDIAISWVKRFGRGHVFYTALGHNEHIAWDFRSMQHYMDGIQFALGDLEAPTTPTRKLNRAVRAQEKLGWQFGITAYTFRDRTFFGTIEGTDELGLAYVGSWNEQIVSEDIPKKLTPDLTEEELWKVRSKLAHHGVTLLTYFTFNIPEDEAECRKLFEFGKKLGIETFISEPKVEQLDMIERFCEEYNIKVALHNHAPRLSPVYYRPENIVEVLEGRSPLLGAAADFGYWAREGINPLDGVKILGDRLITIQMHDQSAFDSEGHDVPWGTGVVPLAEIMQYLHDNEIEPVMFGLEYSKDWGQSIPALKESIQYFNVESIKIAHHLK